MRRQFAQWLESVLFPLLAIFVPWPNAVALFRRIARTPWLYRTLTQQAQAAALAAGVSAAATDDWASDFRFIQLVDRADGFLSRYRGDDWLDKYVTVTGDPWPDEAFVGITFHFGAGLWAMRHLRRCGGQASFLSTRFDAVSFPNAYVRYLAARWRMKEVARIGDAPIIYTGGSSKNIRQALADGISVLGLIDVPSIQAPGTTRVSFSNREAWFPPGLINLARENAVPLVVFTMDIDTTDGHRYLTIVRIPLDPEEPTLQVIVDRLEDAIARHSAAWHRWGDFPLFFQSSS